VFGRVFVFRFTLGRGVIFAFSPAAFAFGLLFAFAGLLAFAAGRFAFAFVLPFALPFAFAFVFLGFFGLFSFAFDAFVLRLTFESSSGVTVSGDSPGAAARLTSIATV
jgi:hypothetical protein